MHDLFLQRLSMGGFLCLMLAFFTACGPASERMDRRDERDPLVARGDARKLAGDRDGAIELYLQALDRRPNLALAHLKLAYEYDEYKKDFLRAIFHYNRYLELRPRAQKNELIRELIRMAHVSYLASLPNPPPGAVEKVAMQERELERLRGQIEELTEQLRAARQQIEAQGATATTPPATPARPAASPAPAEVRPEPAPAQPPERTYRVERGDTLSRIAGKMYNDSSQWNRIFEANRDQLATPQHLREGQVLVIP